MITDWATIAEPAISPTFLNPCYATDIQILNSGKGVCFVTPDGTKIYRVFVDFDGAIASEFVNTFGGIPATNPLPVAGPYPVFGQVAGDLLLLSSGKGILMPAGMPSSSPRSFYRLRIDNTGMPGTELANSAFWMKIPENNIPVALDVNGNWVFTQDIVMVTPGAGIVIPKRGGAGTRRVRIDFDGAIISE